MASDFRVSEAQCRVCGRKAADVSYELGVCVNCVREKFEEARAYIDEAHAKARKEFNLPAASPKTSDGVVCGLCHNLCSLGEDEVSYCGLRWVRDGQMRSKAWVDCAVLHAYTDPLPTNCCSSWFCPQSKDQGRSLAVFFYGCGFDCMYCQNASHKKIPEKTVSADQLVSYALEDDIRCVCFFGGSPEPQLPYALAVSERIIRESDNKKRICWETNGSGDPNLMEWAANVSYRSGGNVKFDLKAYDERLNLALCGVSNRSTLSNFKLLADRYSGRGQHPVVSASTLLVPGYVDALEVGRIAEYIASADPNIPYALLAFQPDYLMYDLPYTAKEYALECEKEAEKHLNRVNVGNKNLLV